MLNRICFLFVMLLSAFSADAQEATYPVITSDAPPPIGLYRTADDYLNLRPSETDVTFKYIPRSEGESFYAFFRQESDGKKGKPIAPKEYFAASDGKTFYISHGGRWNKAKKSEDGYYFISVTHGGSSGSGSSESSTLYVSNRAGAEPGGSIMVPIGNRTEHKNKYKYVYSIAEGKWTPAGQGKNKRE